MTLANQPHTLAAQTAPGDEADQCLQALVASASIEATPRQILMTEDLPQLLPAGTPVYVPFLPNGNFADTLAACRRLLALGMHAVPHVPARMAESQGQLDDWLAQLQESGVNRLLLIAGDRDAVAGPFPDTLAVLESHILARFRFHGIGVAAHPEGHPRADKAALVRALEVKQEYARTTGIRLWVVTQFTFEAQIVIDWLQSLGTLLEQIPVYIGLAGPTSMKTLLSYAAQCGVGASSRMLLRRPGSARLLRTWTPDSMVRALVQYRLDNPETLLKGIHLFPFGGLRQSAQWIQQHSRSAEDQRSQTNASPV
ncbi:methylenetetrahydrofolate reductase [Marinobacter sp. F4206]|uniref:methylenetetrahydrofolate reductase n=1 Tax=Marinobacter sp. F4206 TaxID=2861777 RepID=UPI001C5E3FB3|nr:methylenetetrahydrofolate reductase [Marinobacter sp. F4206]MBW4935073.1 methylenetetrahydrofolate reductase [Marinobacter sp. F4206]